MQVGPHAAGRRHGETSIVMLLVALGMASASPCVHAQSAVPASPTNTTEAESKFSAPTDTPAQVHISPARSPLLAVASAGPRLVAVGLRGLVVLSDDGGKTWTQAKVPVEVDLTAVTFSTPMHGWAVGHRGVVLESQDGGGTWSRRFAGQQLNELAVQHYRAQRPEPQPKSAADRALGQAARAIKEALVPSILDVWFDSPTSGTLVGTFNLIFRTEDGGKTWAPCMDRTDNPDELHFYAVRGGADGLYLAGEKGSVWRLDANTGQWLAAPTGYTGTLFGLVVKGSSLLAYGMRGSVFTSDDAGRHWQAGTTPRKAGLAAGLRLRNGDIVLADQAGGLLRSHDAGRSFVPVPGDAHLLAFSLALGADGQLYMAGPRGVGAVALPASLQ